MRAMTVKDWRPESESEPSQNANSTCFGFAIEKDLKRRARIEDL